MQGDSEQLRRRSETYAAQRREAGNEANAFLCKISGPCGQTRRLTEQYRPDYRQFGRMP